MRASDGMKRGRWGDVPGWCFLERAGDGDGGGGLSGRMVRRSSQFVLEREKKGTPAMLLFHPAVN